MTFLDSSTSPVRHADRLFIGGSWVKPSSTSLFEVIDATTELPFLSVAEANEADMDRAIGEARRAFDDGPWPKMSHVERAGYLQAMAAELRTRGADAGQLWPRESGALYSFAEAAPTRAAGTFDFYASLSETFPFEEEATPSGGGFGLLVREPVGVVGAIVPWNAPLSLASLKTAPALLAGCAVVLKMSPEAPGLGYLLAESAEAAGLPAGVFNVVTAERQVSEQMVRDARVDKITFTGSTQAGRRIASLCGERIARVTLELGGKSAAVLLDDADIEATAASLSAAECMLTGQVCASITRIIVLERHHDEMVEALVEAFGSVRVGDPFDPAVQMGPLATERQRDRVEDLIAQGVRSGANLALGGDRPPELDRGYYIAPTVFGNVDNRSSIAQEEIFGPVLAVIPAVNEDDAVRLANDTIYGLNASVFTADVDRARAVAARLRSGMGRAPRARLRGQGRIA